MPDRMTLIRDVAVFQVKVIADGLRDLLLVPISLISGLISLIGSGSKVGPEFYELLRLGRRSEKWINLFGAAAKVYGPPSDSERFAAEDLDEIAMRVETFIVNEYKRGGVTAQAKQRLDYALDNFMRIRKGLKPRRRGEDSEDTGEA